MVVESAHTPTPWVGFADQGKLVAIMPAMRGGDICTFAQSPSDADGRFNMPGSMWHLREMWAKNKTTTILDALSLSRPDRGGEA